MLEMLNALWRPITGFIMAAVVLLTALGWLPPSAEDHANSLLAAAGAVLLGLTGMRGAQRVAEVKAEVAKAQATATVATLIPGELLPARTDPGPVNALAEAVEQRLAARGILR